MEDMAATAEAAAMAEAAKTAEVAEMAEAAKAAEWAAIVEAEAVKITPGEAVSRKNVAQIPNPAIRPLPPNATSRTPQNLGMPKPLYLCNGAGHSQLPTWRIFG